MQRIILASQSPRRRQLLEWAEVPFEILVKHTDESYPGHLPVHEVPAWIARHKARAVADALQTGSERHTAYSSTLPIVAADTVVILNNEIIGKPENRDEAISHLTRLSGQTHTVVTGVAILCGDAETVFSESTEVSFHELNEDQLAWYVDKYQPYDKAGAYAIQEWIGVVGIRRIEGDFYNVMGLPVARLVRELHRLSPPA